MPRHFAAWGSTRTVRTAALALCATVVLAEVHGPVMRVVLVRALLDKAAQAASQDASSEPTKEDRPDGPVSDPVLVWCASSDWDRNTMPRPRIELKRQPLDAVQSIAAVGWGRRSIWGPPVMSVPCRPRSVAVNPNGRPHAPPQV